MAGDITADMELFAAEATYWDLVPGAPLRRDPVMIVIASHSQSHLSAISMDRAQMIEEHPRRSLLPANVVALDVDALIAVKSAWIALRKSPAKAKGLFQRAKALRAQANAPDPDFAVDPRSRGGKTSALNHRSYKLMVAREFVAMIRQADLADDDLTSKVRFAVALQEQLANLLINRQHELPASLRKKVRLISSRSGSLVLSDEALSYAFGLIGRMLKPNADPCFVPVRAAYEARKKGQLRR